CQLIVGTSNPEPQATNTTGLRRLNVPGSGLLGTFGAHNGRNRKLSFVDADGTKVTMTLKGGGMAKAFYDGSKVDLLLSGTGGKSALTVKTIGGDGRVNLRNIQADGGLKNMKAKTADLSGTMYMGGELGKIEVGTVTGTLATSK